MKIKQIELLNFRNYEKKKMNNLTMKNIIIGDNGTGKTSILESIYIAAYARSFKTNDEKCIINKEKDFYKIKILVENDLKKENKIEYLYTKDGKKTKINGKLQPKISNFICQYKIVLFSPDELKLLKESPTVRRNYINMCISQIDKTYIPTLNKYNNLIKQKNELLKKIAMKNQRDDDYFDILDLQIVKIGKIIYEIRKEYFKKINKYIKILFKAYKKDSNLYIKYNSFFEGKEPEEILKYMKKNRINESLVGITKIGVHRDDYDFIIDEINAKDYCSEGIQKLIIFCMKMSELDVLINDYYEEPILLLDDLFSELDEKNQNLIISKLNKKTQIFITTTDLNNIKSKVLNGANVIKVDGGN